MKTKYPNMFGILAVVLLVVCFALAPPTYANADSSTDVGQTSVVMPAMLSGASGDVLSPTYNGEIVEPTLPSPVNVAGAIFAILLIGLAVLVVLVALLSPRVRFFRYILDKFIDLSGGTDSEEVHTLHRVHQVHPAIEAKPAS